MSNNILGSCPRGLSRDDIETESTETSMVGLQAAELLIARRLASLSIEVDNRATEVPDQNVCQTQAIGTNTSPAIVRATRNLPASHSCLDAGAGVLNRSTQTTSPIAMNVPAQRVLQDSY